MSFSSSIAPELKSVPIDRRKSGSISPMVVYQITTSYMPKVASAGLIRSTPRKIPEHPQDQKVAMIFEMKSNHSDEAYSLPN